VGRTLRAQGFLCKSYTLDQAINGNDRAINGNGQASYGNDKASNCQGLWRSGHDILCHQG